MTVDVILYHGNCPDGFCAAYVAQCRWPSAVLIPVVHGGPIPTKHCAGRHVLVVDFSWTREICEALAAECATFMVIDHHKTAQAELDGLPYATFDLKRSGATMAWDILRGGPRPWYVNYVEDRDLARYALPDSKAVSAYIMALPHTTDAWDRLSALSLEYVKAMGTAIRLHIDHYIQGCVQERQIGTLAGRTTAIVNAAYLNISDVAMALLSYADIGCGWFERGDKQVQFSLRSVGDLDVSAIAQHYGGGGHKNAAGFQLPYRQGYSVLHDMLHRLTDQDRSALHIDRILHPSRPWSAGVTALLDLPVEPVP